MKKKQNSNDEHPLRGRALEIYEELSREFSSLPSSSPIPSVRDLRRRFAAGQQTLLTALHHLGKKHQLQISHGKRTFRSAEPCSLSHSSGDCDFSFSHLQKHPSTVLAADISTRWRLEPLTERYNRSHNFQITVIYKDSFEELSAAAEDPNIDFIFYHTHPGTNGRPNAAMLFLDLTSMASSLDSRLFYPCLCQQTPDGHLWGISTSLSPSCLIYDENLIGRQPLIRSWEDFGTLLRRLRSDFPSLDYSCLLDGYFVYLLNSGLRLADSRTRQPHFSYQAFAPVLNRLRSWIQEALIPPVTDAYSREFGRELFEQARIGLCHRWLSCYPFRNSDRQKIRYMPMPADENTRIYTGAEFFSICLHSINYENAWNFIEYALTPESQITLTEGKHLFPVRRNLQPAFVDEKMMAVFEQYLSRGTGFSEDYLLPGRQRQILEVGIDRWIRTGGNLETELQTLEKQCLGNYHSHFNQ